MADYILGPVSNAGAAEFDRIQQTANQPQTQVFDASVQNSRMLFFAFDGTGNNKDDPSLGPVTNVARLGIIGVRLTTVRRCTFRSVVSH